MRVPAPILLAPALLAAGAGIGLRSKATGALADSVLETAVAERDLQLSEALAAAIHAEVLGMAIAAVLCVLVAAGAMFAVLKTGLARSPGHLRILATGSATLSLAFAAHGVWLSSIAASHQAFVDNDVDGLHAAAALYAQAPMLGAVAVGVMALVAFLSLLGGGLDLRGAAGAGLTLLALVPLAGLETLGWAAHEALLVEHHRAWSLEELEGVQLPAGEVGAIPAPRSDWLVVEGSLPARELGDSGWVLTASGRADNPLEQLLMLGGTALEPAPAEATWFVVDAKEVEIRVEGEQPQSIGVGGDAAEILAEHPERGSMVLVPGPYWSVEELLTLCGALGSCRIAETAPEPPPPPRVSAGGSGAGGGVQAPASVKQVVGRYQGQVRFCYEQALKRTNPGSRVTLRFTMDDVGAVTSATASGSKDRQFEACVERRARTWRFPEGNAGEVVYPFILGSSR